MNKRKIMFVMIALVLIVAFATNPTREQYINWVKERVIKETGQGILGIAVAKWGGTVIEGTTRGSNYVLFSVYKTKIINDELVTLGVFHQFFSLGRTRMPEETEKHNNK